MAVGEPSTVPSSLVLRAGGVCLLLEIESCSGGGGRADLGVLARTDRTWASDCIDPLERQLIEAGTSLLLPPEMVGSHGQEPLALRPGT